MQRTIDALSAHRNAVRRAVGTALTATAEKVKDAEYREMLSVFDRPTPYTLNSLLVKGPTSDSDQTAIVWLKYDASRGTPADKYLNPQIHGGSRPLKRFERALRAVGALPDGYFAVPGSGAKMDAYGNMQVGQIIQILSYFQANPRARANTSEKGRARLAKTTLSRQGFAYFVGKPGGGRLPLGVWQLFFQQKQIQAILIFVRGVHYDKRFDFDEVGRATVQREFPAELKKAIAAEVARG